MVHVKITKKPRALTKPLTLFLFLPLMSSMLTFHILGAISSYIPRQFNAVASSLRCYIFHFTRVDQLISSFNQSIAFIIPVLTTFLELKYHGNDQNKTPFATHPTTMLVAVSSSVIHYFAYIVLLRFPLRRFAVVAHYCLVWSGYSSVASLASLLFPDYVSPFVYAIFVLISVAELLCCLYHKLVVEEGADFLAYRRAVCRFSNNICRVVANSYGQRPQILPI